jgi:hypothetical protein
MRRAACLLLVCLGLFACARGVNPGSSGAVEPPRHHWDRPLLPQGDPPADFADLERSLQPEACGACHPVQLQDWLRARHSRATGPGLLGQTPSFGAAARASCFSCHAPLFEQQTEVEGVDGRWSASEAFDDELLGRGVSCAACHVRERVTRGPAPLDGGERDMAALPHAGFEIDPLFTRSEFCAPCHQFPEGWRAFEGKLLENTVEEWRESPQGRAGTTCQGCHMPDRRHHFLGIHDKSTTLSAITIEGTVGPGPTEGSYSAVLSLANTGAGHHLPTYTTPRIVIDFQEVGADGQATGPLSEPQVIQRAVVLGTEDDRELFDTRIPAGELRSFRHDARQDPRSVALRARVRVWPDFHYEGIYEDLLRGLPPGSEQAELISRALTEARDNRYVLWTEELPLPDGTR